MRFEKRPGEARALVVALRFISAGEEPGLSKFFVWVLVFFGIFLVFLYFFTRFFTSKSCLGIRDYVFFHRFCISK